MWCVVSVIIVTLICCFNQNFLCVFLLNMTLIPHAQETPTRILMNYMFMLCSPKKPDFNCMKIHASLKVGACQDCEKILGKDVMESHSEEANTRMWIRLRRWIETVVYFHLEPKSPK